MTTHESPRPQPLSHLPPCAELDTLLEQRVEHPERSAEIDTEIMKRFETETSIFVLDMSGFSRTVQRYGIIHYLAMIRRMRRIVRPAVEENGGAVVKYDADNVFAIFPDPDSALKAAIDVNHDLEIANLVTADESDVYVSIGIGHGRVLLACDDLYGDEMNLASKLGEDVAEKKEILLTSNAHAKLKDRTRNFQKLPLTVSGVTLEMFRLMSDA